jgi:hypothetical protein
MVYDNKYFILDKIKMKKIFVFNTDGSFSHTIGSVGGGPGEYVSIDDFTIDKENERIVILTYPSTIYVYNLDGKYILKKRLSSDFMLWNIASYKDGFVCSTNHLTGTRGELIFLFDKKFSLKSQLIESLDFPIDFPPFVSDPIQETDDKVLYFDNFTATMYLNITNKNALESIHFEFGKKMSPEIFKDTQSFFANQNNYCFFINAFFAKDILLATFFNKGKLCDLVFNVHSGEKKITYSSGRRPQILCYHENYLYVGIDPLLILDKRLEIDAKITTNYPIEFDSNVVILRFKMAFANE